MAAGVPFLGFTPPRPLRVFYLQAEIQYHYLRERMQQIALPAAVIAAARDTFIATPKLKLLLDAEGVARVAEAIRAAFPRRAARHHLSSTRSATSSMAAPRAAARTTTPP